MNTMSFGNCEKVLNVEKNVLNLWRLPNNLLSLQRQPDRTKYEESKDFDFWRGLGSDNGLLFNEAERYQSVGKFLHGVA